MTITAHDVHYHNKKSYESAIALFLNLKRVFEEERFQAFGLKRCDSIRTK